MRLKYYLVTLRQMKLKKSFVFFLSILLITIFMSISILNKNIKETMAALCEENSKKIALRSTNAAVSESIQGIKYTDLITVQRDNNGKIDALVANMITMNKVSNKVTTKVEQNISSNNENYITVPMGSFIGMKILAGYGKKINIKTIPVGSVRAEFKSTFESTGINQTKHKILLDIITDIRVIAPFYSKTQEYINTIVIAETVIVGDTPSTYYDIQGLQNLTPKDTLDIIEQ